MPNAYKLMCFHRNINENEDCKILEGSKCDATDKSFAKCNKKLQLNTPSFTKVETGCDAFASNAANVKIRNNKCKFNLETGGCPKYKYAKNK